MLRPLHSEPRSAQAARHDRRYAASTLVLGLAVGATTTVLVLDGAMPLAIGWPSAGTAVREVVLYVLLFDAYFYGLHRLLHTRVLYRRVHAVHHRSRAPTVVTALAFHPVEALLVFGFMPVAMWLVPIHLASLAAVSLFLSGSIALAHCGYEVFPPWWERVPVLGWYVTPRVHDAHHVHRTCNFSATLVVFDRMFGTRHAATGRHRAAPATASSMRSTAPSVGTPPARANGT